MKVKQFFQIILTSLWLFSACDKKDDCNNRGGDYSHGVIVVNEGPFGGTGTITWHDPATGETVQDVYGAENCGASLGEFVQSIRFHQNKGYIVVNGANKIVIVDERTFKYLGVIEGFELPRFFLPIDDRFAYVSQWGADGLAGSLAKVDLQTKRIVKTIPVGSGPEKMLFAGNRLFVANSGGYGVDSTVVEINTVDDEVELRHPTFLLEIGGEVVDQVEGQRGLAAADRAADADGEGARAVVAIPRGVAITEEPGVRPVLDRKSVV